MSSPSNGITPEVIRSVMSRTPGRANLAPR